MIHLASWADAGDFCGKTVLDLFGRGGSVEQLMAIAAGRKRETAAAPEGKERDRLTWGLSGIRVIAG
jgi:hypothetical protein